jgi:mono/diheme cytochrome c family protein
VARQSGIAEEERKSYSAVFLFLVGMLLAGAVWSIWDENISRRPWKKYQAEFFSEEIKRAKAEADKANGALEANPEYVDLKKRLGEAEARVESGEQATRLAAITAEKDRVHVEWFERDLRLRIKKSEIEEAWYELEHAQLTGHATEAPKKRLDDLLLEKTHIDKEVVESENKETQLKKEADEIMGEVTAIKAKIEEMETDKSRLDQRLDGLVLAKLGPVDLPRIPKIEQIVIPEYEKSNFEVALSRVDRCTSCHSAVAKAGYDDLANPLKTHPHKELMDKHPTEQFGCTPCHEGQGPAVNSPEQAHGEVNFWEAKLLRGDMKEANCIKCHPDSHHLEFGAEIGRAQVLFEELGCHGCHLTEGYEELPKVGPSLKRIAAKADPSWLVRWVKNPHEFRPKTRMPNFLLTEAQATDVAAFLLDSTKKDSQDWLDAHPAPAGVDPANAQLVTQGKELVDSLGCRGCHGIAPGESPALLGTDKDIAPNLSGVAEKTDGRWAYHWIKNPRGYSSVSKMPSLRLSDEEARAIASFLMTLGTKKEDPAVVARLQEPEAIQHGEALVRKFGCFGCHEVTGMEKESRIGVELSSFGNKGLEELYFGETTDIPHTWAEWTYYKLKNPRIYQTERIEQLMPQFDLSVEDIRALRVFLKSRTEHRMPARLRAQKASRDEKILAGRRMVQRYNCVGCHVIEDRGGAIRQFYTESPNLAPPVLNGEGAKVQEDWLFGFLQQPEPLRPWLKVRMPTFGLSDEESTTLVQYFAADSHMTEPFVHIDYASMPKDFVEAGKQLASVDYFSCFSCHQQGDKKPEGPPDGWAPDLSLANKRLNPEWIVKWLEDPQKMMPGTKMPAFYPGGPDDILDGNEAKQREALRDYLLTLGTTQRTQAAQAGGGGNS